MYLLASSPLSAVWSWTVTTVQRKYTFRGVKTHSAAIYLSPPLIPLYYVMGRIESPHKWWYLLSCHSHSCFPNSTRKQACKGIQRSLWFVCWCAKGCNYSLELQKACFSSWLAFQCTIPFKVNSDGRPKERAKEWKKIITRTIINSTGLTRVSRQYEGKKGKSYCCCCSEEK